MTTPFTPGFSADVRRSVADALSRMGEEPLRVERVTVKVSNGNPAHVARMLDPRPISAAEWAVIEGGL